MKIKFFPQIKQALRHDYEIVVLELQQADTFAYQTTLMAFVNCLILVEQNLRKRMCVRNEFVGRSTDTRLYTATIRRRTGIPYRERAIRFYGVRA